MGIEQGALVGILSCIVLAFLVGAGHVIRVFGAATVLKRLQIHLLTCLVVEKFMW